MFPSAYTIGQQAGRESGCSERGSQGQSGPSERESVWWGENGGGDSSSLGGSLQTKHHRRSMSMLLNSNILMDFGSKHVKQLVEFSLFDLDTKCLRASEGPTDPPLCQ